MFHRKLPTRDDYAEALRPNTFIWTTFELLPVKILLLLSECPLHDSITSYPKSKPVKPNFSQFEVVKYLLFFLSILFLIINYSNSQIDSG